LQSDGNSPVDINDEKYQKPLDTADVVNCFLLDISKMKLLLGTNYGNIIAIIWAAICEYTFLVTVNFTSFPLVEQGRADFDVTSGRLQNQGYF